MPAAQGTAPPPKSRTVHAGTEHVGVFGCGHGSADRQRAGEALGQGHDVWFDSGVLPGEQLAGTAEPGLHFIKDEQGVVLVGQFTHGNQIVLVQRINAAFTLDDFEDYGADTAVSTAFSALISLGGTYMKPGTSGLNGACFFRLGRGGQGRHGAAMKPFSK